MRLQIGSKSIWVGGSWRSVHRVILPSMDLVFEFVMLICHKNTSCIETLDTYTHCLWKISHVFTCTEKKVERNIALWFHILKQTSNQDVLVLLNGHILKKLAVGIILRLTSKPTLQNIIWFSLCWYFCRISFLLFVKITSILIGWFQNISRQESEWRNKN